MSPLTQCFFQRAAGLPKTAIAQMFRVLGVLTRMGWLLYDSSGSAGDVTPPQASRGAGAAVGALFGRRWTGTEAELR